MHINWFLTLPYHQLSQYASSPQTNKMNTMTSYSMPNHYLRPTYTRQLLLYNKSWSVCWNIAQLQVALNRNISNFMRPVVVTFVVQLVVSHDKSCLVYVGLKVAVCQLLWILMSDFLLSAARDRATLAASNSLWCIIECASMYNAAWNVAQHSTPRNNWHRTDTHFSSQKSLLANRAAKVTSWNLTLINHF